MAPYPSGPINQWPAKPHDFRKVICEYRNACLLFSKSLLRLIALSLDLEEEYFNNLTTFPMAGIRPLWYPTQDFDTDVGIGAHADYSCTCLKFSSLLTSDDLSCRENLYNNSGYIGFTLVNQLSMGVPALEVLNHNGHWVSAPPIANTLVVNVGDFLERATNDIFQSTVHRVINSTGKERYSIPYFFNPSYDAFIEVVPTCITKEMPTQYKGIKAGDWQRQRLISSRYKHPAVIAKYVSDQL
jgi:isopenicillin N synthase-like dioxygenase